jgi:hypothetical protein
MDKPCLLLRLYANLVYEITERISIKIDIQEIYTRRFWVNLIFVIGPN